MKQKVETTMLNEETGMQQRGATSGLTFRETVIDWQKCLDDTEVLPGNQGCCWLHEFREEWAVMEEKDLGNSGA